MDGKTGESLDSDGGNDGRGNNLPESTGHTVNHEMETPLNFKGEVRRKKFIGSKFLSDPN